MALLKHVGICLVLVSLSCFVARSQDKECESHSCSVHSDSDLHSIKTRPAFFNLSYRMMPGATRIPTQWERPGAEIDNNYLIESKLTVPLKLKGRLKLLAQLRYKTERFNIGEIDNQYDNFLQFHNSSVTFIYKYSLQKNWFVAGHYSTAIKADSYQYLSSALDYGGSFMVGRKCEKQEWGIGFAISNVFGRFRISPVVIYNTELSRKWLLDIRLPKHAMFKYAIINDNFYWYNALRAIGANYRISDPDGFETDIEYRRRSLDVFTGLEKSLVDWLWIGIEAGYNVPVQSLLVERGAPSRDHLHSFRTQHEPFIRFRLFAVPPSKLFNKIN